MSSILVDPHTLKVDYPSLPDLATGRIPLFATDDFFSPSVNLFLPTQPVFDPDAYTPWGKEMDGWETRRKRIAGHDFLIVALTPGVVRGVGVSTRWFTGNNAPRISIQAFNGDASVLGTSCLSTVDHSSSFLTIENDLLVSVCSAKSQRTSLRIVD